MKFLSLLLALALLGAVAAAPAEEAPTFAALTGLDEVRALLDGGAAFTSVYYTDGYGFSSSEFTTEDPDEMEALFAALCAVEVAGETDMSITDWYPLIVFTLSDGHRWGVRFEANWLVADGGRTNYELTGDAPFWALTRLLRIKHEEARMRTIEVVIGEQIFEAELADNETASVFRSLLPMTLRMTELNGNEKYHYLQSALPADAYPPEQIRAGDIRLFGDDCVVLFYDSFSTGYSYTDIGRILSPGGLAEALGTGAAEVTFRERE